MTEWPEYETRKRVRALPIVGWKLDKVGMKVLLVEPAPGETEVFQPTEEGMANRVDIGDYAIAYPDGFRSVNIKANFEASAMPVPGFVWSAVRTAHADIAVDTLRVSVTTHILAFSAEVDAAAWIDTHPDAADWCIVKTALDPPPEAT